MGFYLGSLLRGSSWNILIVLLWVWVVWFFSKGRKEKQVPGSDPAGLPTPLAVPSGTGRANGPWSGSLPSWENFWGGSQGEPFSSSQAGWSGLYPPGPPVHPQPLPKGSNQQVRAPRGGLHPQLEALCLPILWLLQLFKNSLGGPAQHPLLPGKREALLQAQNVLVFGGSFIC